MCLQKPSPPTHTHKPGGQNRWLRGGKRSRTVEAEQGGGQAISPPEGLTVLTLTCNTFSPSPGGLWVPHYAHLLRKKSFMTCLHGSHLGHTRPPARSPTASPPMAAPTGFRQNRRAGEGLPGRADSVSIKKSCLSEPHRPLRTRPAAVPGVGLAWSGGQQTNCGKTTHGLFGGPCVLTGNLMMLKNYS